MWSALSVGVKNTRSIILLKENPEKRLGHIAIIKNCLTIFLKVLFL